MPGSIPGIPGLIAFAGVKFGGYCLAGWYLKKLQPAVTAKIPIIAGARTGLGILIGPPLTIALTGMLVDVNPGSTSDWAVFGVYGFVYVVRILIWALHHQSLHQGDRLRSEEHTSELQSQFHL